MKLENCIFSLYVFNRDISLNILFPQMKFYKPIFHTMMEGTVSQIPIIDYLSILVCSSTQRKISKLQPLQNRAIRIVKKLSGYISRRKRKACINN